jgi:dTDP-4-dehydrorhamnose reductase
MTNVDQCEGDHAGCRALNVEAVSHLAQACALPRAPAWP